MNFITKTLVTAGLMAGFAATSQAGFIAGAKLTGTGCDANNICFISLDKPITGGTNTAQSIAGDCFGRWWPRSPSHPSHRSQ